MFIFTNWTGLEESYSILNILDQVVGYLFMHGYLNQLCSYLNIGLSSCSKNIASLTNILQVVYEVFSLIYQYLCELSKLNCQKIPSCV